MQYHTESMENVVLFLEKIKYLFVILANPFIKSYWYLKNGLEHLKYFTILIGQCLNRPVVIKLNGFMEFIHPYSDTIQKINTMTLHGL